MRSQSTPHITPHTTARSLPRKAAKAARSDGADWTDGRDAAATATTPERACGPTLLEGPTREQMIRVRAYDRYQRNGCVDGHELDDWLAAEAEIGALMTEGGDSAPAPCA